MLQSGNQLRFTETEIEQARELGIDLSDVKTKAAYSNAIIDLMMTLEHERPALLEKIAKALAESTGKKLPTKLNLA